MLPSSSLILVPDETSQGISDAIAPFLGNVQESSLSTELRSNLRAYAGALSYCYSPLFYSMPGQVVCFIPVLLRQSKWVSWGCFLSISHLLLIFFLSFTCIPSLVHFICSRHYKNCLKIHSLHETFLNSIQWRHYTSFTASEQWVICIVVGF